jgi:hypothetical protein
LRDILAPVVRPRSHRSNALASLAKPEHRSLNEQIGIVRPYLKTNAITLRFGGAYDLAPDGRVLVNSTMGDDTRTITMVVNWPAGLPKK